MQAINYVAVLAAGIIQFALGGLWYAPFAFGKKWLALVDMNEDMAKKGQRKSIGITFLASLVSAYVLANVVNAFQAADASSGAQVGLWVWLGFYATTKATEVSFRQKPWSLWFIDAGFQIISLAIGGVLFAVWK